ncbi:MAG: DUF4390 domain-containing protein [Gemmatimonadota bacterium]
MSRARLPILLAMLLAILRPATAAAQSGAQVRFEVGLSPDSTDRGARAPMVRLRNLLEESRWISMLRSGFPLRIHYRLELWRSRQGWFDVLDRQEQWDVVIRHEPLLDQYTVSRIYPRRRAENRYATLSALESAIESAYRVAITPVTAGNFYYASSVQVTTLSDSDLDELERFLQGDLKPPDQPDNFGAAVGRGTKRLLLKLAGLPSLRLEERSPTFVVR